MEKTSAPSLRSTIHNVVAFALVGGTSFSVEARADETCASPYMKKITGQEDHVYVWTWAPRGSATNKSNW